MSAQRPDLFAPLPVGFFRHPKVHRIRQTHPHAAEGFLVLVAEAESQTRRRGKEDPGFVKMLHAEFALCLGLPLDSGDIAWLLTAYEDAGWIDVLDGDDLSFSVRLLNYREWAAKSRSFDAEGPQLGAKSTSRFSKDPANKGVELVLEEEEEVEVEVDPPRNAARDVFEHWRVTCGHEKARFGQDRAKHINARIREGYTVADLLQAIDGCAASEWHMGKNPQRRKYDELSRIVGNSEQVDKFMAMAESRPSTSNADDFFKRNGM